MRDNCDLCFGRSKAIGGHFCFVSQNERPHHRSRADSVQLDSFSEFSYPRHENVKAQGMELVKLLRVSFWRVF